jgi:hypothetical protein
MPRLVPATLALAVFWVSACGSGDPGAVGGSTSAAEEPPPTVSTQGPKPLYEADAIVLEDGEHGPMLCLGAIRMSLPPHCGDVPIADWDWRVVQGEELMAGTIWGGYHVVGTFDGEVFTVTEVGQFENVHEPDPYVSEIPCYEPEGGWKVSDPEHNTQEDADRAHAYARAQPDYAISWNDHLDEDLEEFGPVVFVAVFTGQADRHEAEIRKVWNGPLCVVERDVPPAQELARIRKQVESRLPDLGLRLLGSGTGGFPPAIFIEVVADVDGRAQEQVDREYGPGVVRFLPALRPVE